MWRGHTTQRGRSGRGHFTGNDIPNRECPTVQHRGGPARQSPVVWIVGHSFIRWGKARAQKTLGLNLGTTAIIFWFGHSGLTFDAGGRLFYTGEGIPKPVVMTPEERETVLQECHDYCGHRSKRSTADRVCQKYYWRTGGLTQTTGVEDGIDERIQEAEMMFDKIRQNIGKAQRKQKKDYESRHKNTNESNFHGRRGTEGQHEEKGKSYLQSMSNSLDVS
ncbi:hypothetical protein JZ751_009136 [Albula glossodonta]|uniref:Integrase zinc-binding domain-containing protein n=1 Tax=Albula glossodonta TaxID=121402 RepID=A0A8T2N6A1_9TELE|nr:hypothetical protein JZ751_030052 [Albula glossodonta]KAG9334101.1 hypothetical protein JZ751_009136 [Albula glossodonta]